MVVDTPSLTDLESESKGDLIFGLNVTLLAITSIVGLCRFYVRIWIVKTFGWEDTLAFIAMGLLLSASSIELVLVGYGAGSHIATLSEKQINSYFLLMPINQLILFLAAGLIRLSILIFLPRLCKEKNYMRWVWGTGSVIIIITLFTISYFLADCRLYRKLFLNKSIDEICLANPSRSYVMSSNTIVSVFIDIVLFGLPIWMIRETMVFNSKATKAILVFGVGLVAIIVGIVKACMLLTTDLNVDTTYRVRKVCTWAVLQIHLGIWCGSFPLIQPLFRAIRSKLDLGRSTDGTFQGSSEGLRRESTRTVPEFITILEK